MRTGPNGRVQVERDGDVLAEYNGPVGYLGAANYFKFGPYDYSKTQKEAFAVDYAIYWRSSLSGNHPQAP